MDVRNIVSLSPIKFVAGTIASTVVFMAAKDFMNRKDKDTFFVEYVDQVVETTSDDISE